MEIPYVILIKLWQIFFGKSPPCEAYLFNFHQGKTMYKTQS